MGPVRTKFIYNKTDDIHCWRVSEKDPAIVKNTRYDRVTC